MEKNTLDVYCPKCGSTNCVAFDQNLPSFDSEWLKEVKWQFDSLHHTEFRCECNHRFHEELFALSSRHIMAMNLIVSEVIRTGLYAGSELEPVVEMLKKRGHGFDSERYYSQIKKLVHE